MGAPMVSIVIPVYNGGNYLAEAIDSALAQTYDNCEVIVVNDGSNDGGRTEEICLSYGDKIRYYKKENGGVATAVNLGIRNMRGEYFSWLSHDDVYYPDKIKLQTDALQTLADKTATVFGNFEFWSMKDGHKALFDIRNHCDAAKLTCGVYPALFGAVHACTMLVHKSRIAQTGEVNEKLRTTQDIEWIFRLMRGQKTVYIDRPLIAVRQHSDQGKHHISCYGDEQGATHVDFMNRISDNEILELFGSAYIFYYQMASFYQRDNNWPAFEYAKSRFDAIPVPADVAISIAALMDKIYGLCQNQKREICIFCAGNYGKRLKNALAKRDISISCFSDNKAELWGKEIAGVLCHQPGDIRRDALIFVAKEDPLSLQEELKSAGFLHVFTYADIIFDVESTTPLHF